MLMFLSKRRILSTMLRNSYEIGLGYTERQISTSLGYSQWEKTRL